MQSLFCCHAENFTSVDEKENEKLTNMSLRVSRVGADHAALQQTVPVVPAAFVNAAIGYPTTQGVNALHDYILFLSGQPVAFLSSRGSRAAYTALRDLIPRPLLGLPAHRIADVDREKAVIVLAAGRYITALLQRNQAVLAPAPAHLPLLPPAAATAPAPTTAAAAATTTNDDDDEDDDDDDEEDKDDADVDNNNGGRSSNNNSNNITPLELIDPRLRELAADANPETV